MYRVQVVYKGDDSLRVRARESEFLITPLGKGFSPVEVFLGSLASCMGVLARRYLEKRGAAHAQFSITVEAELSVDAPMRFKDIAVSIDLKGNLLSTVQRQEFIEAVKSCPVYGTLKSNPAVTIKLV